MIPSYSDYVIRKKNSFLLPFADFNSLASFWYFLPREFESGHFGSCYLEVSKSHYFFFSSFYF